MSVMIVTSVGDIVVDLHTDKCPLTCKNFLKLCKIKYYNGCLFHTVQRDFTAQTGDPTGTGNGGDSIYKFLYGDQARFFMDEIHLDLKHSKMGTIAMASAGENLNASQFYFTLRDDLDYLDGRHTVFGEVAEGLETLTRINEAFVDGKGRPLKNIRIKHAYILDDPFDDPSQLAEMIPDASPEGKPKDEVDDEVRLEDDWVPLDEQMGPAELEEVIRAKEAHSSAVVLESIGDIPEADVRPPDNVLFVCKLNPVTEDEDLHTIFSRFGTVVAADIIRDFKTGDSLCYAFIEFETKESCEQAYFKMDNALIDDRRIHVDFSQSVSKLWSQYRRKDNQGTKGKGCFKCGAPDHMARDCIGGPTNNQPVKYILKEDNVHRGGGDDSRYDMVFDEDHRPESPARGKRHQGQEDREEKRKMRRHSPEDHQAKDRRNTERDKYRKSREDEEDKYRRQSERSSSRHREDEADDGRRSRGGHKDEQRDGGREKDSRRYKGGDGKDDYRKRDGQAVKSRDGGRDREEREGGDREYSKKKEDDYYRDDRRSSRDSKSRSSRDDHSRDRDRKHRHDR